MHYLYKIDTVEIKLRKFMRVLIITKMFENCILQILNFTEQNIFLLNVLISGKPYKISDNNLTSPSSLKKLLFILLTFHRI